MLRLCARQVVVAARACPRVLAAKASSGMPPKKTPPADKEALKGQRNIASFFKGPAGAKRQLTTPAIKAADGASPPANKPLQPAETNGTAAVPTDKRPLKRLKKAAVADAPKAASEQPEELTDVVEDRSNGTAQPSSPPATPELPAASADGTKGTPGAATAEPTPAGAQGEEVRPAAGDEGKDPDIVPEAHLADIAQAQGQQQHVEFKVLTEAFDRIGSTTKRLEMTAELKRMLRLIIDTSPSDLLPAVYLISNRIAPAHAAVELGIGEALVKKAICKATGVSASELNNKVKKLKEGQDLGNIAVELRRTQKDLGFAKKAPAAALTIKGVYDKFWEIARAKGSASQDKKQAIIQALLMACNKDKGNEAGVIIRALLGKLRIGLAEQTLLVSLAQAVLEQRARGKDVPASVLEEGVASVKQVYSECPVYDELIPALLKVAAGELPMQDIVKSVAFRPGLPVKSMLAKATNGISEVLDKYQDQPFTVEYKYDGERAQIHVDEHGKVHIFSRNSESMLEKYPDLEVRVPKLLAPDVKTLVVDCEAVAWDIEQHRILPFQQLSTRARKNVKLEDIKVQVYLFAFDCLYLNGRNLLGEPLTARREALTSALVETPDQLQFAQFKTSTDIEELSLFLDEAVAAGTEGLIVKSLDSTYEPSKRSVNWLKLKKDYLQGVGDTFDVVPIGAFLGRGKRGGVYGAFLLAVYDEDNETFQTISKIGTGFSEELLKELHGQLKEQTIDRPPKYYSYATNTKLPDVWLDAKAVWEVKAADLSISPVYKAATGLVDPAKGISIRFPRLVRVRDDKAPEQATSPEQIAEMYQKQASQQKRKGKDEDED